MKDNFRNLILKHIKGNFNDLASPVRTIGGLPEHLHVLFLLNQNQSIASTMKSVKGESSHWINQQEFIKTKFAWQVGYAAFSISESLLSKVEDYINHQKSHHRKMTFNEEYIIFLKKHGLQESKR